MSVAKTLLQVLGVKKIQYQIDWIIRLVRNWSIGIAQRVNYSLNFFN